MIEGSVWSGMPSRAGSGRRRRMRGRSSGLAGLELDDRGEGHHLAQVEPLSAIRSSWGPRPRGSAGPFGARAPAAPPATAGRRRCREQVPSRSTAAGSRSRTGDGSRAASRNARGRALSRHESGDLVEVAALRDREVGRPRPRAPARRGCPRGTGAGERVLARLEPRAHPRERARARNTSGCRTRPIAWSWRPIASALAPGGTTRRTREPPRGSRCRWSRSATRPGAPPSTSATAEAGEQDTGARRTRRRALGAEGRSRAVPRPPAGAAAVARSSRYSWRTRAAAAWSIGPSGRAASPGLRQALVAATE